METTSEFGPDEGPAQKVSVSLPAGRIAAVKAHVGARGFSAFASEAIARHLQRELAEQLLQASEEEVGPIPQEMHDRAAQAIRAAKQLAAREHSAGTDTQGDDSWHGREAG